MVKRTETETADGKVAAETAPEKPPKRGREVLFLARFLGLLALFFLSVAPRPVNDAVVEPFTAAVARAGGFACRLFGEKTEMVGTVIRSTTKGFAVNIRTGCNGLETIFIFAAAVLAFPAPWRVKLLGLLGGIVAIQLLNLVRIVSLFYIGLYWPALFAKSHIVVWQMIIILFGVALWLVWADRYALPPRPVDAKASS